MAQQDDRSKARGLVPLSAEPSGPAGAIWLVGAGPGDPELLTLKALKALQGADVVVHDGLVSEEILDLAPASARRISVAKRKSRHSYSQDEINRMIVAHNFQLGIAGLNINTPSPATSLEKFFATGNTFNGYANPEFDAALKELRRAVTLEEQKAAMAKLQTRWNRDQPAAIYGASENVVGWDDDHLHGLVFNADDVVRFDQAYVD